MVAMGKAAMPVDEGVNYIFLVIKRIGQRKVELPVE